jgi:hypothetical protein
LAIKPTTIFDAKVLLAKESCKFPPFFILVVFEMTAASARFEVCSVGLLSEKNEPKSSQGQVNVLILVIEATISAIWYFSYWLCVVEHCFAGRTN